MNLRREALSELDIALTKQRPVVSASKIQCMIATMLDPTERFNVEDFLVIGDRFIATLNEQLLSLIHI